MESSGIHYFAVNAHFPFWSVCATPCCVLRRYKLACFRCHCVSFTCMMFPYANATQTHTHKLPPSLQRLAMVWQCRSGSTCDCYSSSPCNTWFLCFIAIPRTRLLRALDATGWLQWIRKREWTTPYQRKLTSTVR